MLAAGVFEDEDSLLEDRAWASLAPAESDEEAAAEAFFGAADEAFSDTCFASDAGEGAVAFCGGGAFAGADFAFAADTVDDSEAFAFPFDLAFGRTSRISSTCSELFTLPFAFALAEAFASAPAFLPEDEAALGSDSARLRSTTALAVLLLEEACDPDAPVLLLAEPPCATGGLVELDG